VLDELAGWQAAYDTEVGKKLVREMVIRDVNHPSIILWDNGNEGGWNTDLDDEFMKYDPQQREVIHPYEKFRKTDTNHYIDYNYGTHDSFNGTHIYFPTEFLHGLYDGGHGAGLEDYWNLMLSRSRSAGGFLWVFADEAVVRTDREGMLDADGNHAPDGILGPYREKEGSFYAIREIWAPVYFEDILITDHFEGSLQVENRYHFTDLDECRFSYRLVEFPSAEDTGQDKTTIASGSLAAPSVPPGKSGTIRIDLPENWREADALYITVHDPSGKEIITWDRAITLPDKYLKKHLSLETANEASYEENEAEVRLTGSSVTAVIEKNTGMLKEIRIGGGLLPFRNGPRLEGGNADFEGFTLSRQEQQAIYEANFSGNLKTIRWTMQGDGLLRLEYVYFPENDQPFFGINFDFPEEYMRGITWLGDGPYRVWKNRLKGNRLDIWNKDYNNTITGETWDYPEFKGYHANLYWARFNTEPRPFSVYTSTENLYLRLFTPDQPEAEPRHTEVRFPEGNISFLNGINAIGTKFKPPEALGPQSQINMYRRHRTDRYMEIELFFDFR
jgi:hypothetical protein